MLSCEYSRGVKAVVPEHELFDTAESLMVHYVERMYRALGLRPILERHSEQHERGRDFV